MVAIARSALFCSNSAAIWASQTSIKACSAALKFCIRSDPKYLAKSVNKRELGFFGRHPSIRIAALITISTVQLLDVLTEKLLRAGGNLLSKRVLAARNPRQ